jgi:hypothetical protein
VFMVRFQVEKAAWLSLKKRESSSIEKTGAG